MTDYRQRGRNPQQVLELLSQALSEQAALAHQLDAVIGELNAPVGGDLAALQAVDRLRQTLDALAKLSANAANAILPEATASLSHDVLCDGVHLEAVRALIDPKQSGTSGAQTSLFI